MIELTLPYPPSANTYWRHPTSGKLAGRHLLSEKGRAYREAVKAVCWQKGVKPLACRVMVEVLVFPPDRRRRDLDNVLKGTLDSLTAGGVWADDSQIDKLTVERGQVVKDGALVVRVSKRGEA